MGGVKFYYSFEFSTVFYSIPLLSMTNPLHTFIAHARSKNMDPQSIRMLLLSAGWREKDISEALASEALDLPVPLPPETGSARDAFFHLLAFTTLYSTVISLIILLFQYIDVLFPDLALQPYAYDAYASSIRWCIAIVIVSFPCFVLLSRALVRDCILHPEKLHSGVRKWLTYLTLFVTSCTLIGDLITLLFSLLQGDLTTTFVLKVLVIFVLAGATFLYYFLTLRMQAEDFSKTSLHRSSALFSTIVVLATVLYGFVVVGGPGTARLEQMDLSRVTDLQMIQNRIYDDLYGNARYSLPARVTSLPSPLPRDLMTVASHAVDQKIRITDPATGAPYVYRVRGTSFELCATFDLASEKSYSVFWDHPAGEKCFLFDALDPTVK